MENKIVLYCPGWGISKGKIPRHTLDVLEEIIGLDIYSIDPCRAYHNDWIYKLFRFPRVPFNDKIIVETMKTDIYDIVSKNDVKEVCIITFSFGVEIVKTISFLKENGITVNHVFIISPSLGKLRRENVGFSQKITLNLRDSIMYRNGRLQESIIKTMHEIKSFSTFYFILPDGYDDDRVYYDDKTIKSLNSIGKIITFSQIDSHREIVRGRNLDDIAVLVRNIIKS